MQATFPGIAGIYYGDEIGLNGGNEPNNREAFPWNDEGSWDINLQNYIREIMNIKSSNNILKYGNFQLLPNQNDAIVFRRALRDKSLLCIFNRSENQKNIKIPSTAHGIEQIFGNSDIQLDDGNILISELQKNTGLIIFEN